MTTFVWTSQVDSIVCKTCHDPDPEHQDRYDYNIVHYFGHRVGDRVIHAETKKKGECCVIVYLRSVRRRNIVLTSSLTMEMSTGGVMWVSKDRSHVRVLMDEDKMQHNGQRSSKFWQPCMAGGKAS